MVGLVTGSARYPGAAVLTAKSAARSNAGMIRYMGPQRAQDMVLTAVPEAVLGKGHVQSWVIGSGVPSSSDDGAGEDIQRETIAVLLEHYALTNDDSTEGRQRNAEAYAMPPIMVDAGALSLLPAHVPAQVVITPHAGELAALLNRLHHDDADSPLTPQDIQAEPLRYATMAHELTGATT